MGSLNVKVKLSSCFNINIRAHVTHDFLSLRRRTAPRPRRPPPSDSVARHNSPTKVTDRVSLSLTSLSTSLLRSLSPCPVFQRRLTVLSAHQQTNATVFLAGHIRLCSAAVAGIVVLGMVLDILDCFWLDFIYPLDIWPKYCLTHRSFEVIKAAVRHGKRNFWTFLVSIRAPIPYGFNFDC